MNPYWARNGSPTTRRALPLVAVAAASLAACADAPRAPVTQPSCATAAESVSAAAQRPVAFDNARDLTGVLTAYTDDVIWMPPTGDVVSGKEAIKARYKTLFAGNAVKMSSEVVEAHAGGDIAWARGFTLGVLRPERGGAPVPVNDKFVALLRCESGTWRISHLIWTPRGSEP